MTLVRITGTIRLAVDLPGAALALALALTLTLIWLVGFPVLRGVRAAPARVAGIDPVYLPFILGPPPVSPAGAYSGTEHEYGVTWQPYAIELRPDGTSVHRYLQYAGMRVVTGTRVFTPFVQTIGFTNFHWLAAIDLSPGQIRAELRTEPGPGSPLLDMWCWRR